MKKLYIFHDHAFTLNDLQTVNPTSTEEIEQNLRNRQQLKVLLIEIHKKGDQIALFTKFDGAKPRLEILNTHLDQLIGMDRDFLKADEDLHYLRSDNIEGLVKELVVKFNEKNSNEMILDKDLSRVILIDTSLNRTKRAQQLGCNTINVSTENDNYLTDLRAVVRDVQNQLEHQYDIYRAHERSIWQRHKGKITLTVPPVSGAVAAGAAIGLPVGGELVVRALIGFGIGAGTTGALLVAAYIYTSYIKKQPIVYLESGEDEESSLFDGYSASIRSTERSKVVAPSEETALLPEASQKREGPIASLTSVLLGVKNKLSRSPKLEVAAVPDAEQAPHDWVVLPGNN